ncbi:BA14K family protein [Aestuariivirga sp.]|uniref:BA14K family protein n=1 Tax=Aestuariivirga sp. TaxID=2650926 RepID=UPI003919F048
MRKLQSIRLAAMALAVAAIPALLPPLASPAAAFPANGDAGQLILYERAGAPSLLLDVKHRPRIYYKKRHDGWRHDRWRYNHRHHGSRYRYRYPGYPFFYGGFWYSDPWWRYDYPYYGYYPSYRYRAYDNEAHVEWCLNRYRSYNPRTDTFLGYDGRRHRCNSPYD